MMLGGSELVEVGVWGRMSIADTRRQAGWQASRAKQGNAASEAKLWFVTAQDSPSKITWARPARPVPLSHRYVTSGRFESHVLHLTYTHAILPVGSIVPFFSGPTPILQDPCRCITPRESGFLRCA